MSLIHSPSGWSIANWRNTLGRSSWTSWCWHHLRTGDGSSLTCGLGCPCGIDRIGCFTDFAAPINCCWCGHTCHWCNRQHWSFIQLTEGITRMLSWHLLQSSSVVLQPEAQNEKVETLVWSLIWSFSGWSCLEILPNRNLAQLLVGQQWLFSKCFHSLPWQKQVVQAPNPWLLWKWCC